MNNDSRERPYPSRTADEYTQERAEHERVGASRERGAVVRWLNERAAVYGRTRAHHNGPGGSSDLANVIEGLAAAIERGSHVK